MTIGTVTYDQVLTIVRQLPLSERSRLVELLMREIQQERTSLDEMCDQALASGQDPATVQRVREGKAHPVLLDYGLLKDDESFERLMDDIPLLRQAWSDRPVVEPWGFWTATIVLPSRGACSSGIISTTGTHTQKADLPRHTRTKEYSSLVAQDISLLCP